MRIDVVGRDVEITEAIRTHAEAKSQKLLRHFDRTQLITITAGKADHHGSFGVEVVVDVEHHDPFVAHAAGPDLYGVIEGAIAKSTRQLTDFKEKTKIHR